LERKVSPEALLKQALRSIGSDSDVRFIRATDATSRKKAIAAGDGWIQIGDPALTIDPLTSNGLYLAALSSVQATRVINTIMRRPDDAASALTFYAGAQTEIADHCASYSDAFYRSGMRGGTGETTADQASENDASKEAKKEWSSLSEAGCDQFARLLMVEGIVVRQTRV
jgi:flavin-dependent dehydrogenase